MRRDSEVEALLVGLRAQPTSITVQETVKRDGPGTRSYDQKFALSCLLMRYDRMLMGP